MAASELITWAAGTPVTLAIAFTDIVGSTVLRTALKDERVNDLLRAHFTKASELVAQLGGYLVKTTGDGVVAVFRSAGSALDFAREIHAAPGYDNLRVRVGIHVGEVDIENDEVTGIEVHIAARLIQSVKDASICLSERAKSDVERFGAQHHTALKWVRRSGIRFKGFETRRFTLWILVNSTDQKPIFTSTTYSDQMRQRRGVGAKQRTIKQSIGDRPTVAVLPFTDLSPSSDQAHFADGIADDIISELASCRIFPVIARNSSFAFRERGINVIEVGRHLGARYIVDGSFSRIKQRVRISGRLVDVDTGIQIAEERFEPQLDELPEIQGQITEMIVGSIAPEIVRMERQRLARKRYRSVNSYEYLLRGIEAHYRYTKFDNQIAQGHLQKAIELDPQNAQAHAVLAHAMIHAVQLGWREDEEHNYVTADLLASRSVQLDPRAPFAHFALGSTSMFLGRIEAALGEMKETVRINPSHAPAHSIMASLLCYVDRADDALNSVTWGLRLSPYDPRLGLWLAAKSQALYFLKEYKEAATVGNQALILIRENPLGYRFTAASLGQLGRKTDAAPLLALIRKSPAPTLDAIKKSISHLYQHESTVNHLLEGLRKAGLE